MDHSHLHARARTRGVNPLVWRIGRRHIPAPIAPEPTRKTERARAA